LDGPFYWAQARKRRRLQWRVYDRYGSRLSKALVAAAVTNELKGGDNYWEGEADGHDVLHACRSGRAAGRDAKRGAA
jgi:hypothetical protein